MKREKDEREDVLDPGSNGTDGLLDVGAGETRNGDESDVRLHVVAGTLEERRELTDNLVVSASGIRE